jgi:RimJ/RimL family protein N-acetyltransferase
MVTDRPDERTGDCLIQTARLCLRPMRGTDAESLSSVFGDPNVMAAFSSGPLDRTQVEAWVRRNLDHQDRNGYGLFAVLLRETGLLIGDCGLERMTVGEDSEVELGYDLRSDHWGRGYATEAALAVRDYAFGRLDLPRLISLIRRGNDASRRVAEKIGMQPAGEVERDGRVYWLYRLSRADQGDPTLPVSRAARRAR